MVLSNIKNNQFISFLKTCDICGTEENPTNKHLKCGYGWENNEKEICDNIVCSNCQIKDLKNNRIICKNCFF